ncbi:MAG TPA: hypothetical protein VD837_01250 [Terriglobales bacterium]|nr:hypothetical protein [Terriglobales bacterium]
MGMDIRLPIGLMFAVFGLLLIGFGILSDKSIYERSLGLNINLGWGIVLLVFGLVMLALGRPRAGAATQGKDERNEKVAPACETSTRSEA